MRLFGAIGIALIATAIALFTRPALAAGTLPLNGFLQQVQTGNDDSRSNQQGIVAGQLRTKEYKLLFLPNLVAEFQNIHDARPTAAPVFQGTENKIQSYSLGLEQNFGVGLDAKLLYKYADTTFFGTNPQFFPQPHYITASPVLEINASLWRNFLGSEVIAQKDVSLGGALAQQYTSEFSQLTLNATAESAYWRLATARKLVAAAQDNLKRADRIQSWASRRSRLSLSDKSDYLQANATVAQRKIELQNAADEERAAARDFNKMRGSADDVVPEELEALNTEQISQLAVPNKVGPRQDVQAAEQNAKIAHASAKLSEEKFKPDVSVYAQLSFNSRDTGSSEAINQSFESTYPMNTIGVKLSIPLAVGTANDIRAGYRAQASSADLSFKRKAFEGEKDYQDLAQRFEDSKKRLTLASESEKAQKSKLEYERERFSRGRTTTYQVILFEQDFAAAQIARLNLERDILDTYAQLKTYGGSK